MEQKIKDAKHFIAIIDERIEVLTSERQEPDIEVHVLRYLRQQISNLKSYKSGALYVLEIMEEE